MGAGGGRGGQRRVAWEHGVRWVWFEGDAKWMRNGVLRNGVVRRGEGRRGVLYD